MSAIQDAIYRIRNHEYTTGMVSAENLATLMEQELSALRSEIERLQKENAVYKTRVKALRDKIDPLRADNMDLQVKNERLQKAVEEANFRTSVTRLHLLRKGLGNIVDEIEEHLKEHASQPPEEK
jgi:phage shock protein A